MNLTQALGWTLIHFVWQGAIAAILLACVLALLRQAGSHTRYAVSCAAMVLMLGFAAATFVSLGFSGESSRLPAASFTPALLDAAFDRVSTSDAAW